MVVKPLTKPFVSEEKKIIIIKEDKRQSKTGSIAEKLQTGGVKRDNYKKQYPNYNIHYIYCLSSWYRTNCIAEIEYLDDINIPVFWSDNVDFKNEIKNFIINCE